MKSALAIAQRDSCSFAVQHTRRYTMAYSISVVRMASAASQTLDPKKAALAKKIYMDMPIVRFDWIAKQTGLPQDALKSLALTELWLHQRRQKREAAKKRLERMVTPQQEIDLKTISMCDRVMREIESELSQNNYRREEHSKLLKTMDDLIEMRARAYERVIRNV